MADPVNKGVHVELVGWRNRKGQFAKLVDAPVNALQGSLKQVEPRLLKIADDVSPVGKYPFGEPQGHVRFGKRWHSSVKDTSTGAELVMTNDAPHAGYVIFPTRAHDIAVKNAKRLRFMGKDGQVVFARSVRHPGTKGNNVPAEILRHADDDIHKILSSSAAKVAAQLRDIFS